jgi:hypothetical protein
MYFFHQRVFRRRYQESSLQCENNRRALDPDRLDSKIEINDPKSVKYDFDGIKIIPNIVKSNPKGILN